MIAAPFTGVVIDTSTKLTSSEATALYAAGVRTVGRYVFFRFPQGPGDLDAAELAALVDAGLTVFAIQHVRNPGWTGSYAQGVADAQAAIANAQAAGYVGDRLCLALDLEGCKAGDPDQAAAWCSRIAISGYRPLVYIGYASGMVTPGMDALAGDPRFWCDYAPISARPIPSRGYSLHQQAQTTLAGVGVDRDTILDADGLVGLGPDVAAGTEGGSGGTGV